MTRKNPQRALYAVLLTGGVLSVLVWCFTIPATRAWFEQRGLHFTSVSDVRDGFIPKQADTARKQGAKPLDTALVKQLSAADQKKLDTLRRKINYLDNYETDGGHALDRFFTSLGITADSVVHIWYYGDSQIEGDRITQDLRILLQQKFGGSGQGFVPFDDVASYRSLDLKTGKGWVKQNVFIHRKARGFGFAGVKFTNHPGDTAYNPVASMTGSAGLRYDRAWLLFGKSPSGQIIVSTAQEKDQAVSIPETTLSGRVLLSGQFSKTLKLKADAPGTDFYGYLLESSRGIQVDNCGIRGHSGDGLFNISDEMLRVQSRMLNTKLVVFHYGNNAIPYLKSEKQTVHVGNEFYRLFVKFKKALPGVSILVVSGGDMGRMVGGEARAYPFAQLLALEIGKAAEKAGCAFFDMHALMLKEGGIIGWKKKGWANLDGHLSASGQLHFAKVLFQELMREYEVYRLIGKAGSN